MPSPKQPVPIGSYAIDCTALAPILTDLPYGKRGMCKQHEGFDEVILEILTYQAAHGERAGITNATFQAFCEANDVVEELDARLPALRKLLQMMEDTRARYDDKRQRLVNAIAASVDRHAQVHKDEELLAHYERTRDYRSAHARKGVKTRNKKKAERASEK
jgi:hypothetical protein